MRVCKEKAARQPAVADQGAAAHVHAVVGAGAQAVVQLVQVLRPEDRGLEGLVRALRAVVQLQLDARAPRRQGDEGGRDVHEESRRDTREDPEGVQHRGQSDQLLSAILQAARHHTHARHDHSARVHQHGRLGQVRLLALSALVRHLPLRLLVLLLSARLRHTRRLLSPHLLARQSATS